MTSRDPFDRAARAVCTAQGFAFGEHVGSGAFKHTYKIEHNGHPRALKIYKSGGSQRIGREVSAIRRCNHKNIVRLEVIDSFLADGVSYIFSVEEYLSGGTLSARLAGGTIPLTEVRLLATHLASALQHLDSLRLVHRDIKPDNIMFRDAGMSPVLVDFGLVRDLADSSLTRTWAMQGPGTPYYAAPEQLNNDKHQIDWRTDQFALGVVLAQCAIGRHPYQGPTDSPHEAVEQVRIRKGPSSDFVEQMQRLGAEQLVRMVQPWPVRRFRTSVELSRAWSA